MGSASSGGRIGECDCDGMEEEAGLRDEDVGSLEWSVSSSSTSWRVGG